MVSFIPRSLGRVLALVCLSVGSQAQAPVATTPKEVVTFAASGYEDQSVQGLSGASVYYLRLPATGTLQNSRLVLFLKPSQALMKNQSSVTVLVRNQPVFSLRLDQLDPSGMVAIPLSEASREPGSPFVQVEVKTQLNITDDRCKDLENPALWLKISGESYLAYQRSGDVGRLNLSNCLAAKEAIVYPARPSTDDIRLVSALYSRLSALRPGWVALYAADKAPDTLRNAVVVGLTGQLPARYKALLTRQPQSKQGLFFLHKGGVGSPEALLITATDAEGYAKTVGAVTNPNVLASAFGHFLVIDQATSTESGSGRTDRLTLSDLGGTPDLLQGIGSLRGSYSFRLSDFARQPDEIEVHLEARYSGLQPGDRGFLNLYLNGALVSTSTLDKSGQIAISPRLKRYLLKPYNSLQAEFRFFPGTNVCQNSFVNFVAQVDAPRSYLSVVSAHTPERLSFMQFPGVFQNEPLAVVISRSQMAAALPGICELVRQMNAGKKSFLSVPAVFTSEAYRKADDDNLVAFLDRNDALWTTFNEGPVQFNRDFRLYSDNRSQPLFIVSDSVSCGTAQIFRQNNRAVLVLAAGGPATDETFRNAARYLTEQTTNLASNVLITSGTNRYLFNLTEEQSAIDYTDGLGMAFDWWGRYNLYVLGALLVLVLLAFLYVRAKVKGAQAVFEN